MSGRTPPKLNTSGGNWKVVPFSKVIVRSGGVILAAKLVTNVWLSAGGKSHGDDDATGAIAVEVAREGIAVKVLEGISGDLLIVMVLELASWSPCCVHVGTDYFYAPTIIHWTPVFSQEDEPWRPE